MPGITDLDVTYGGALAPAVSLSPIFALLLSVPAASAALDLALSPLLSPSVCAVVDIDCNTLS
jgi:hypothetical protein